MLTGRLQMAISALGAVLQSNLRGTDFIYFGATQQPYGSRRVRRIRASNQYSNFAARKSPSALAGAGPDYRGRVVFEKLGMRVGTDVVFVQTVGDNQTRLAMRCNRELSTPSFWPLPIPWKRSV